jgi:LmeA-like phospholipid-binding
MPDAPNQPGLISKILSPAIRLWLKSQTDHLDHLTLDIQATDRSILSGKIPKITLSTDRAVYQGIHLSNLQLLATNIHINLPQILRGKPLQLLAPIPLDLNLQVTESDLNASLNAPLLKPAITDFLQILLQTTQDGPTQDGLQVQNLACRLDTDTLTLWGELLGENNIPSPIALRAQLHLTTPNTLTLTDPTWLPHANAKRGMTITELQGYCFDLGPDTHFTELKLTPSHITTTGTLTVLP